MLDRRICGGLRLVRLGPPEESFSMRRASVQDERLSWAARGLLAYLCSLPDHGRDLTYEGLAALTPGSTIEGVGLIVLELHIVALTDAGEAPA